MSNIGFDLGGSTVIEESTDTSQKICPRWKVILWNDDHHSFDFVINMIMKIFKKEIEESVLHTLEIHDTGCSVVTTCSNERAQLYLEQVSTCHEYKNGEDLGPLSCTMEPDE